MELFRTEKGEWISDRHMLKLDIKKDCFVDPNSDKTYPAIEEVCAKIKYWWEGIEEEGCSWCLKEELLALLKEKNLI
jgi:hypothetical protein